MLKIAKLRLAYQSDTRSDKPAWNLYIPELSLEKGQIHCLTGTNGSGKTSLLNSIANIIPAHIKAFKTGDISFDGNTLNSIPLNEMYRFMAYQMSDVYSQFLLPTAEHELSFALQNMGLDKAEILQRLKRADQTFKLQDILRLAPDQLSAGQQKLLLFGIVDALDASLILMDEPAAGLSEKSFQLFREWLLQQKQGGKLLLLADHDPRVIALADSIIAMDQYVQS